MDDTEVFKLLMEELRLIRKKLDDSIASNTDDHQEIQKDLASIRAKVESHNARITGISAGISLIVAAIMSWFIKES